MSNALVQASPDPDGERVSEDEGAYAEPFSQRQSQVALDAFNRSCDEAEAEADRDGWLSHEKVFAKYDAKYADIHPDR